MNAYVSSTNITEQPEAESPFRTVTFQPRLAPIVVEAVEARKPRAVPAVSVAVARPVTLDRVARITALLKTRDGAEEAIAAELRAELDARGERAWLAWCLQHWGWKRASAYVHLNPGKLAARRVAKTISRLSRRNSKPVAAEPGPGALVSNVSNTEDHPQTTRRKERAVEMIQAGFQRLLSRPPNAGGVSEAFAWVAELTDARDWAVEFITNPARRNEQ